jgi:group I intron endonuclease
MSNQKRSREKKYRPRHNKWRNEYQRICYTVNGGVYRIQNKANGRCYYGSTQNLRDRFCKHLERLKAGKHYNEALQRDFIEHGEDAFEYIPLVASRDVSSRLIIEGALIAEALNRTENPKPYNLYKLNSAEPANDFCRFRITREAINQ